MEQRFVEIELKLVGLEDTVQSLNEQIYEQGRQLDELRALCRMLVRRLDDSEQPGGALAPGDERPPHY
ncbi:SlyX family protein [Achromobacter sp. F4_2707]|uniref:SlyX family protein n=1 Tax=Achromobacter sp. F4_2707 TaxID=3114286 RepID=UPI0039C63895